MKIPTPVTLRKDREVYQKTTTMQQQVLSS